MARNNYRTDEANVKQQLNFSIIRRLFSYISPYKKSFTIGAILLLINVLVALIWPKTIQWLIDEVLSPGGAFENNASLLVWIIVIVFLIMVTDIILSAFRSIIITKLGQFVVYDIRKDIFNHLQTLSFRYFDDRAAGKILENVTTYVDSLANLLSSQIIKLAVDSLTLIFIFIMLLQISTRLTLLSFIVLIPLMVIVTLIRNKTKVLSRFVRAKGSNRSAYIHESVMGIYTTQAFSHQEASEREFNRVSIEVNDEVIRKLVVSNLLSPAIDIFSNLGKILVYFFAVIYISSGTDNMTLGALTAFLTYLTSFWSPITSFATFFEQFASATSNIEHIFETLDTQSELIEKPDAIEMPAIKGYVEYDNVTFGYEEGINVFENVSFTVSPGEMIAFVGPTGSGKTTMVSLLSRFYDACSGSVKIDGIDVKDVTLKSLRTQIGIIMQDAFIFSGTIIDNIRYGNPSATDEECIAAAKLVYADDFIKDFPRGYYTILTEGGDMLSAGQKQLISFARVIISNPKILVLDEATSNIDTHTELLIQKALDKIISGRTSFVIAHRLSTIRNADRIMCIANNTIAESGSHEELMARKGIYYNLNMSQINVLTEE